MSSSSVGEQLRKARESRRLTLSQVADATKIKSDHIAALEEGDFHPFSAPVYIRGGGSIPIAASFERIVGLPVTVMGFPPPSSNAHAPNEWMDLANHEGGIRALIRFFDAYAGR